MNRPFAFVPTLILLLFFSLLISCKKKDNAATAANTTTTSNANTSNNTSCGDGILCAQINGVQFIGDNFKRIDNYSGEGCYAVFTNDRTLGPQLAIYGSKKASNELIVLNISGFTNKPGGFSVQDANARFSYTRANNQNWVTKSGDAGTILLTKYDTIAGLVSGIFDCTVESQNGQPPQSYTFNNAEFTNLQLLGK